MTEEAEGFKVTDRRHRASEDDAPAVTPPAPEPEPAAAPSTPGEAWAAPGEPPPGPVDLRAVFTMFASSALMALGEAADPASGQFRVDLSEAEEAIDVLLLLRDKTEGNRTEEESAFLDDVLFDLQMRFVQIARGSRA